MGRFLAGMVCAVMAFIIPAWFAAAGNADARDREARRWANEFAARAEQLGAFTGNEYMNLKISCDCEVMIEREIYAASETEGDMLVRVKDAVYEDEIARILEETDVYVLKKGDRVIVSVGKHKGG